MAEFHTGLFIFRRDLRLEDNTGLNAALALCRQVVPCFIFDPRQTESHPYQSVPGFQFMLESLADLAQQYQSLNAELLLQHGLPHQVISELHQTQRLDAVFINRDYTLFSRQRDYEIAQACAQLNIKFFLL
ncbi:deoxyribodipyrimidine photo-lyase [Methylocucumis oryzae]|uniref:deoxyribodipyrimidine photo-lyase n=1 Tax=Methylocucumis oryzae TaxID=1632867 RepID=UPI000AFF7E3B|nr:deoxyribodipyrimidine photo-lyase [Methylocucumis oryzae]